jgi:hypothetical protein
VLFSILRCRALKIEDKEENAISISAKAHLVMTEGMSAERFGTRIPIYLQGSSGKGKPAQSSDRMFKYAQVVFYSNRGVHFPSPGLRSSLASEVQCPLNAQVGDLICFFDRANILLIFRRNVGSNALTLVGRGVSVKGIVCWQFPDKLWDERATNYYQLQAAIKVSRLCLIMLHFRDPQRHDA